MGTSWGAQYKSFLDLGRVDGISLASTVPQLVRSYQEFAERYTDAELLELGPGVKTGHHRALRRPARGRPRPGRERRRRGRPLRRAVHRRRLRDLDELRRRVSGWGVRRRRAGAGDRDLDGRPVRARGAPAQGRLRRAAERDRQDDGRGAAVGRRVRLRRPGGRDRHSDPQGARHRRAGNRNGRPRRADLPRMRARSSASTRS